MNHVPLTTTAKIILKSWWLQTSKLYNLFLVQPVRISWIERLLERKSRVKVKSLSYVRLCNPMDCSPPSSSVHGILQARILEWVAISFSRGSSQPRERIQVSCIAGRHFNLWATREAYFTILWILKRLVASCQLPGIAGFPDDWLCLHCHLKREEILTHATLGLEFENIMLSKVI